jgi:hypothetical protein
MAARPQGGNAMPCPQRAIGFEKPFRDKIGIEYKEDQSC